MKKFFLFLLLSIHTFVQAETDVAVFWYEEQETGASADLLRYVISKDYIRIDNGHSDDNFLLYDHASKIIYNVNHYDRTVMVIQNMPWTAPEFSFIHNMKSETLTNAPQIAGKQVISYQVLADKELCADIQILPDTFIDEMKLFRGYQISLSGQLVVSLHNTPKEYHTPCFLLHQVYNQGEYYNRGLPIQEWHSRGYMRILKNYSRENVSDDLFKLPKDYTEYSPIGIASE